MFFVIKKDVVVLNQVGCMLSFDCELCYDSYFEIFFYQ